MSIEPVEETNSQEYPEAKDINEAGGVAWIDLFTPTGAKISLTERRSNGIQALDAIMEAITYASERYQITTNNPAKMIVSPPNRTSPTTQTTTTTPPTIQLNTGGTQVMKVTSLKHIQSKTKKHMAVVTVEGLGEGVFAYESVIPPSANFMGWTLFQEYSPPAGLEYAEVDLGKKTVKSFRSSP